MWHIQPKGGHFENDVIKWGWGSGKIEPQYFRLIWPLRKPKKQYNQFWQKLLILGIFLTITHQTTPLKNEFLKFWRLCTFFSSTSSRDPSRKIFRGFFKAPPNIAKQRWYCDEIYFRFWVMIFWNFQKKILKKKSKSQNLELFFLKLCLSTDFPP